MVALIGPGGAGKSTLLRLVWGEERPSAGIVLVDGADVGALGRRALARLRRRLGIVPQETWLLEDRTSFGNLTLVLRALGASRRRARSRALAVLSVVGLTKKLNAYPDELANGERRRLCLARALASDPPLLLVDEPVAGGLDDEPGHDMVGVLKGACAEGRTVLVATRVPALAEALGARRVTLQGGRVTSNSDAHGSG